MFQDEFSLSNCATLSYGWSLRGKQPIIDCKQRGRERRTVLGAVDYRTGQMTINIELTGNMNTFIGHLENLEATYVKKDKIVLVLDNVKFHHAKTVQQWFKEHPKFEVLFLPPYSPNLNPIERVWWFMRKSITHNRFVVDMQQRIEKFSLMFDKFVKPNQIIKNVCVTNF